jgi:hypothetical protein
MSFLSPWFLAGVAALAVPLWLHRLERQAAERRPWSSLALFRPSPEASVRRRRWRYLVLMACRLLLLAALALAFARPALDARSRLAPKPMRRQLIAVDTSLSMGYGTSWPRAEAEVESILGGLGAGDQSQLVAFGPGVRVLGGATADHGSWRRALASLAPTPSRAGFGALGDALRALAADGSGPLTVHVVSDFQQSAAPARFADLGLPPGATLVTRDVGLAGPRPNWCLESVQGLLGVHGERPADLLVTVAGFDTPAAVRQVELRIDDRVAGRADVKVPAGGRAVARFADLAVRRGQSRAELRLSPADALPADDRFFVLLERRDRVPVLFLRAEGDSRAETYYRTALDAGQAGLYDVHVLAPEAAQTLALEGFAYVVLHDVARLPALLEGRLHAWIESGRAALLILGGAVAREGRAPWIPGRLVDAGRRERPLHASVLAGGRALVPDDAAIPDVRFFRALRPAEDAEGVMARLADGTPLLYEKAMGAGRLLVLTSPLDGAWNDWPVHVSFVPFVASSARWLSGLDDTRARRTVDDTLDLGASSTPASSSIEVLDPSGRRALDLAASVRERRVVLSLPGFYEVRRPGRGEELAVNTDRAESDLRPLDPDTLARWKATGGTSAAGVAEGAAAKSPSPEHRELTSYLLWMLAAVLLVESTLANRYLSTRGPAPPD